MFAALRRSNRRSRKKRRGGILADLYHASKGEGGN